MEFFTSLFSSLYYFILSSAAKVLNRPSPTPIVEMDPEQLADIEVGMTMLKHQLLGLNGDYLVPLLGGSLIVCYLIAAKLGVQPRQIGNNADRRYRLDMLS